jgi:hypothetical protein
MLIFFIFKTSYNSSMHMHSSAGPRLSIAASARPGPVTSGEGYRHQLTKDTTLATMLGSLR